MYNCYETCLVARSVLDRYIISLYGATLCQTRAWWIVAGAKESKWGTSDNESLVLHIFVFHRRVCNNVHFHSALFGILGFGSQHDDKMHQNHQEKQFSHNNKNNV